MGMEGGKKELKARCGLAGEECNPFSPFDCLVVSEIRGKRSIPHRECEALGKLPQLSLNSPTQNRHAERADRR